MIPLIFLDTETTGLCPDIHTPWEVSWTVAHHDTQRRLLIRKRGFTTTVRLSEVALRRADPEALRIGRFDDRHEGAADAADVIAELTADVARACEGTGHAVPHLVGAVPSFDHAMLCANWLGWPAFGEGLWHYHLVDVEVLAAGKLGVAPPYSSSELTAAMGVTVDEKTKHTAAGDVAWAIQLYAAVYNLEVI